jgi:hypothetical protein
MLDSDDSNTIGSGAQIIPFYLQGCLRKLHDSAPIPNSALVAIAATGAVGTMAGLLPQAIAQPDTSKPAGDLKPRWQKLDDAIRG